ncbi:MAG: transposase [candidate division WOR-3 bacterium]
MIEEWVNKFKTRGIAILKKNQRYYAYKIRSVWDPKKKRPRKITDAYLGVVTPYGIFKKHSLTAIKSDYEYANISFLLSVARDVYNLLKEVYPYEWEKLLSFSLLRVIQPLPLKSIQYLFDKTYLKLLFPNLSMSPKTLSSLIDYVGRNRKLAEELMKKLIVGTRHLIIDLSYIFSYSQKISLLERGYNKDHLYVPQINILLGFSKQKKAPSFIRILPGSVRDVQSLLATVRLFNIKEIVLIVDWGFYSAKNINLVRGSNVDYIFPLKRNSRLIPRVSESFEGVFLYHQRPIKFWITKRRRWRVYVFDDSHLKLEEEKEFLQLISERKKSIAEFNRRKRHFGKIYLLSSLSVTAEEIYLMFKQKEDIEYSFNIFKNLLDADKLYAQTDEKLVGYMFVNFLSLYVYYKALNRISKAGLQKRFSLNDVLLQLSKVKVYVCDGGRFLSEIPAKVRDLAEKLGVDLLLKNGKS